MKKIDVNHMIGEMVRSSLDTVPIEQLATWMKEFSIDAIIASHTNARYSNPISGNECLLQSCRVHPQLIPCVVLAPHYKYEHGWLWTEQWLQSEQIRFARIYPREHAFNLHSVHTREIFELAGRLGIHLFIDQAEIIDTSGNELPAFESLLKEYPEVQVILTGIRHRRKLVLYGYLEQYPNFWTEFSVYNNWMAYEETVRLFGSERLLWGSNMPFNWPGAAIAMLSYADISDEDKDRIAYRNVMQLAGRVL